MRVSIIIDNYNYGRYLREAVDSALRQSYEDREVVVVDDGSTDESRDIIAQYDDRIVPVLKENGGQISAFNAGVRVATGEVIIFLDADDSLDSDAVSEVVAHFADERITKVQWLLRLVDEDGQSLGGTRPASPPIDGELRDHLLEQGPSSCPSSPTSGNAWRRSFLDKVMPGPEDVPYYRVCADEYLFNLAPVFGRIQTIPRPLGNYRIHGASIYSARTFDERLRLEIEGHQQQCNALAVVLNEHGIQANLSSWRRHSWFARLKMAIDRINQLIPKQERFLLADGNTWGAAEIFGSRAVPVMEQDGQPWGNPSSTEALLGELERQARQGIRYLVLAWPAFWWLGHYQGLGETLTQSANRLAQDNLLAVYDISALGHAGIENPGAVQQRSNRS